MWSALNNKTYFLTILEVAILWSEDQHGEILVHTITFYVSLHGKERRTNSVVSLTVRSPTNIIRSVLMLPVTQSNSNCFPKVVIRASIYEYMHIWIYESRGWGGWYPQIIHNAVTIKEILDDFCPSKIYQYMCEMRMHNGETIFLVKQFGQEYSGYINNSYKYKRQTTQKKNMWNNTSNW